MLPDKANPLRGQADAFAFPSSTSGSRTMNPCFPGPWSAELTVCLLMVHWPHRSFCRQVSSESRSNKAAQKAQSDSPASLGEAAVNSVGFPYKWRCRCELHTRLIVLKRFSLSVRSEIGLLDTIPNEKDSAKIFETATRNT